MIKTFFVLSEYCIILLFKGKINVSDGLSSSIIMRWVQNSLKFNIMIQKIQNKERILCFKYWFSIKISKLLKKEDKFLEAVFDFLFRKIFISFGFCFIRKKSSIFQIQPFTQIINLMINFIFQDRKEKFMSQFNELNEE
jgi:hypothetical protein